MARGRLRLAAVAVVCAVLLGSVISGQAQSLYRIFLPRIAYVAVTPTPEPTAAVLLVSPTARPAVTPMPTAGPLTPTPAVPMATPTPGPLLTPTPAVPVATPTAEPVLTPTPAAPAATPTPTAAVALRTVPEAATLPVGGTASLVMTVETGEQPVDILHVEARFDPAVVEVASLQPGTTLPVVLAQTFDNGQGTLTFSAGRSPTQQPPKGTFALATVTLRGKARGQSAFAFEPTSAVAYLGRQLRMRLVHGFITVE